MNHWVAGRDQKDVEKKIFPLLDQLETWNSDGVLNDFGRYSKYTAGLLRENQRLYNGSAWGADGPLTEIMKRVFFKAVPEIYSDRTPIFKLVALQAQRGPADDIRHLVFKYDDPNEVKLEIELEPIAAKTRRFQIVFPLVAKRENCSADLVPYGDTGLYLTKDYSDSCTEYNEETITNYLVKKTRDEISREIVTDLRLNVGTTVEALWTNLKEQNYAARSDGVYLKIHSLSHVIHRKTLRGGANWILMHPELAKDDDRLRMRLGKDDLLNLDEQIHYHYHLCNRWRIYFANWMPKNEILLGYKGDSFMDSTYFYSGYIPFTPSPLSNPDVESYGLLTRYAKKLLRKGQGNFGKIIFTDREA